VSGNEILVERERAVTTVIINRPHARNACTVVVEISFSTPHQHRREFGRFRGGRWGRGEAGQVYAYRHRPHRVRYLTGKTSSTATFFASAVEGHVASAAIGVDLIIMTVFDLALVDECISVIRAETWVPLSAVARVNDARIGCIAVLD
jgi:hypothetical protein